MKWFWVIATVVSGIFLCITAIAGGDLTKGFIITYGNMIMAELSAIQEKINRK